METVKKVLKTLVYTAAFVIGGYIGLLAAMWLGVIAGLWIGEWMK